MIKTLSELLVPGEKLPNDASWQLKAVMSDECLSYVAWNATTREALLVDPKREDVETYRAIVRELPGHLWLAVIDTHTHADHVSAAAAMSEELSAPLVMHAVGPSQRVTLRVAHATRLAARAAPVRFVPTPGHTPDGMAVIWGPFLFTSDTVLFNDTGRDDLPGGDAEAHYESLQALKAVATPELVVLPGHDNKGGRAVSWRSQLETNASLKQERDEFVPEAAAFSAPAPALFKESLKENFR
jgi:glyoxylase-like metal-dependent hydrolase (beta-lactamase superfamily II)